MCKKALHLSGAIAHLQALLLNTNEFLQLQTVWALSNLLDDGNYKKKIEIIFLCNKFFF